MIIYLIKSASCLALFLFFYHFILEKEKMHNFNRFYLLGSVLFSFWVPLSTITIPTTPEVMEFVQDFNQTSFAENTTPIIIEESFNYTQIFIGIYLFISIIFLIRFGKNLFKIIQKIRLNETLNHKKAILVLVEDKILPHTFWKHIFINKDEYKQGKIEEELFTHELTHVTQKHTIDVLLIEVLQIVFWINPLFIFLKKAIQLNHEFLADETVINQHKNTFQYQYLLLNKAAWKNEYYLASNLNYSLTKKRLKMMTTQSSSTKILLKKLAVIPLLAGFIFLFAERVEAQEKKEILEIVEEKSSKKTNISDTEIYKEYYHRNGRIISKDKNGKKISKKYSELTKEEKKRIFPPPPLKSKKKIPTKKLIDKLKKVEKYAIWIDGKVVKNSTLENYKHSDFSNFFVSFVHKNARSKRFPQEYQASLYTHKYFNAENEKRVKQFKKYLEQNYNIREIKEKPKKNNDSPFQSNSSSKQSITNIKLEDAKKLINKINEPLKVYKRLNKYYDTERNNKPHFIKSSEKRQQELTELYSKLGALYFKLSKEDKKKVKRPIHPHHPYLRLMKNNKVFYKLKTELTKEDELLIPPPPPVPNASKEEILKAKKAYKEWKKRTGNDYIIPPPPPPRNHLDNVIKMAKKGAKFFFEGKPISSDKAIELLKKNKKLNIHSKSTNNSNYEVWISKKPIIIED